MAPMRTAAGPSFIRTQTESRNGSRRTTPSEFSAWDTYPEGTRFRNQVAPPLSGPLSGPQGAPPAPTVGPSSPDSRNDDTSEGSDQDSAENLDPSDDDSSDPSDDSSLDPSNGDYSDSSDDDDSDTSDDDEDDQSSEGSVPQLDEEAIEELCRKINSSIIVGTRTRLNPRQKWTRTKMFDLEMSEARGGLIFDYDESSIIFGLICHIYDSRQIQGEEGPTLIVVPKKERFDKWRRTARDFSEEFNLHNILIYHGPKRSPGK
ncbi:hypothetical protein FS837_005933 [Tulasnella sp. UAMH 9824]|nr:hypothetical protein FS837_005933 [Tulasnella sp. UAMH 9824]